MERAAALRVAAEREKDGLIVVSAQYGLAAAFTARGIRETRSRTPAPAEDGGAEQLDDDEMIIDVTTATQSLVADSMLLIPGGRGKVCLLALSDGEGLRQ